MKGQICLWSVLAGFLALLILSPTTYAQEWWKKSSVKSTGRQSTAPITTTGNSGPGANQSSSEQGASTAWWKNGVRGNTKPLLNEQLQENIRRKNGSLNNTKRVFKKQTSKDSSSKLPWWQEPPPPANQNRSRQTNNSPLKKKHTKRVVATPSGWPAPSGERSNVYRRGGPKTVNKPNQGNGTSPDRRPSATNSRKNSTNWCNKSNPESKSTTAQNRPSSATNNSKSGVWWK